MTLYISMFSPLNNDKVLIADNMSFENSDLFSFAHSSYCGDQSTMLPPLPPLGIYPVKHDLHWVGLTKLEGFGSLSGKKST